MICSLLVEAAPSPYEGLDLFYWRPSYETLEKSMAAIAEHCTGRGLAATLDEIWRGRHLTMLEAKAPKVSDPRKPTKEEVAKAHCLRLGFCVHEEPGLSILISERFYRD